MASETTNFRFRKDGIDDFYSIDVVNSNLDKIDDALTEIKKIAEDKDGGNANFIGGVGIGKLIKEVGTNTKDFNEFGVNTIYKIQFGANESQSGFHTPLGDTETKATWYNVLTFGEHDNRITQIATLPYSHQRETYIRYKHDSSWSDWKKINDGGNADTVDGKHASAFSLAGHSHSYLPLSGGTLSGAVIHDTESDIYFNERASGYSTVIGYRDSEGNLVTGIQKNRNNCISIGAGAVIPSLMHAVTSEVTITPNGEVIADNVCANLNRVAKKFTVTKGSWFRLARNNKNSCGGIFVLTVGSGASYSSTTVFSATQQYSTNGSINCLSHSSFNVCVSKLRLVNQVGSFEQFIDFYIEDGTTGHNGDFEVQFFGKGWVIENSIVSANIAAGYTTTEFEL